jgi:hypothetical protein
MPGEPIGRERCPHCGATIPIIRDAFCSDCFGPLDEAPASRPAEVPGSSDQPGQPRANASRGLWISVLVGLSLGFVSGCAGFLGLSMRGGVLAAVGYLAGGVTAGGLAGLLVGLVAFRR